MSIFLIIVSDEMPEKLFIVEGSDLNKKILHSFLKYREVVYEIWKLPLKLQLILTEVIRS